MTPKQRLAMAIWNMREWGVHPTWIEYFVETKQAVGAAEEHAAKLAENPQVGIAALYKQPREGNGPF